MIYKLKVTMLYPSNLHYFLTGSRLTSMYLVVEDCDCITGTQREKLS